MRLAAAAAVAAAAATVARRCINLRDTLAISRAVRTTSLRQREMDYDTPADEMAGAQVRPPDIFLFPFIGANQRERVSPVWRKDTHAKCLSPDCVIFSTMCAKSTEGRLHRALRDPYFRDSFSSKCIYYRSKAERGDFVVLFFLLSIQYASLLEGEVVDEIS